MEEKPDWKQWVPYYGLYKIFRDKKLDKPTIADQDSRFYYVSALEHGIFIAIPFIAGLVELLNKLK